MKLIRIIDEREYEYFVNPDQIIWILQYDTNRVSIVFGGAANHLKLIVIGLVSDVIATIDEALKPK